MLNEIAKLVETRWVAHKDKPDEKLEFLGLNLTNGVGIVELSGKVFLKFEELLKDYISVEAP